jgi:hypothetical protein
MWRREEGLGFYLSENAGRHRGAKPSPHRTPEIPAARIGECEVGIGATIREIGDGHGIRASVQDGLQGIGSPVEFCAGDKERCETAAAVYRADLQIKAETRSLEACNEKRARLKDGAVRIEPRVRSCCGALLQTNIPVRNHGFMQPGTVVPAAIHLAANPGIRILLSHFLSLPHLRKTVNLSLLSDSERTSFLQEARALKGIPEDRCELIGVFRHVPAEMISRLQFIAEKNVILYSIATDCVRTRVRIHDMAAVRDSSGQEIHLILHRSRYSSVILGAN